MNSPPPEPEGSAADPTSGAPKDHRGITPPPIRVRTIAVVGWGMLAWVIALGVVLAVPELRSGDRDWWPWVPVAALGLGGIGMLYLLRGRGNAAGS